MRELLDIGFEPIGSWQISESGLRVLLERWEDVSPALYAFVVDGEVMYVGKTKRTLGSRLYGYLKGSGSQRTNVRVRGEILKALREVASVEILGFQDRQPKRLGRFRINLPAGLEDDLIEQLNPPWNGVREPSVVSEEDFGSMPKRKSASGTPTQTTPPVSAAPTEARLKPSFPVAIGKTYFRQGFFNVPMDFERYFAGDGSIVFITLPGRPQPTEAKISRRANRTDAPRVMGGARVRDWLQQNLRVGEKIRVIVHGPKEIEIKKV